MNRTDIDQRDFNARVIGLDFENLDLIIEVQGPTGTIKVRVPMPIGYDAANWDGSEFGLNLVMRGHYM